MGWKSKYLALTGKITLAKSIITTLAYYAMQTTKISRTTSHDIDKEQGDLFGGGDRSKGAFNCYLRNAYKSLWIMEA